MEEKDREIWVGRSRLYLDADNIIYCTPVGDIDEATAIAFKENIFKLADLVDGKVNSLVDLNDLGKPSLKARRIGEDALKHEKVGKLAFVGLHPVAKMLASFIVGLSQKNGDMRFFKKKEEALAWLKE